MNKMYTKVVRPSSLASILVVRQDLEVVPEAFRCQPKVNFIVTFNNYIKFIEDYLKSVDYLATSTKQLKYLISLYKPTDNGSVLEKKLISSFMKDMALSVGQEVFFAERLGKGASKITHTIPNGKIVTSQDVTFLYNSVAKNSENELLQELRGKGYPIRCPISSKNISSWEYAVVTYYFSMKNQNRWTYNIN